ncbi:MAG: hypothetical protein JNL38_33565 [Myxococcales bacterium]|nr:hypothetical protein [Myxococcales bacterium]
MRLVVGTCLSLAALIALAACGLERIGGGPAAGGGADAAGGGGPGAPDGAAPGDAGADALAKCDPLACEGKRCVDGACGYFASCRELHNDVPVGVAGTGVHKLGKPGAVFDAFCEMTIAGGGWTLAGESHGNLSSTPDFGWNAASGSLSDTSRPYSLDVVGRGVPFTEVLAVTGRRDAIVIAYLVTPPPGFPSAHRRSGAGAVASVLLNPSCKDATGDRPDMLSNMGYSDRKDLFFFRDNKDEDTFGLEPDGWETNDYDDCPKDGRIAGKQGAVFVR